ncbi:MAG: OmpA family protein [Elusimicrobia bacterium]|nr:OmpA family protein [Elusimicrobiota bacterium]
MAMKNGGAAGLAAVLVCALALSSCVSGSKKLKREPSAEDKPAAAAESEKPYVPGVEVTEASLRGSDFTVVPELETIRFDYDSSALGDASLAALKMNAEYLKARNELDVRIAGYCDERGTVEYNLALGQKRAKTVREYYIRLGVPGASLSTISYGKESPTCSESTEDCWTQNRRAETAVRLQAPAPEPAAAPVPASAPVPEAGGGQ